MTRKITWSKKDLNKGRDSSGVSNIEGIKGTENGIKQGYQHGSLTKGLVAYYPMERGKGQIIRDAAHNNTGQIKGAEWTDESEIGDHTLNFDGENDYVLLPPNQLLQSYNHNNQLAICCWIFPKNFTSGDNDMFWAHANADEGNNHWIAIHDNDGDSIYFRLFDEDNNNHDLDTGVTPDTGRWHHIVALYDGSEMRVYLNGELIGNRTSTFNLADGDADFPENRMTIGSWSSDEGDDIQYNTDSQIAEFRIYDRAISEPEIQALYNLTRPNGVELTETDLPSQADNGVSLWKFDDDQDMNTAIDSWGNNDGVINGSKYTVDRVYGTNSMVFDGDSYIETGFRYEAEAVTFSYWFSLNQSSFRNMMMGQHDSSNEGRLYIGFDSEDEFQVGWGDKINRPEVPKDTDLTEWNMIALTANGVGRRRLYLNGALIQEFTGASFGSSENNFRIGDIADQSDHAIEGKVDEVRIYQNVLSPLEVEKLYNKGAYRINRGDTLQ